MDRKVRLASLHLSLVHPSARQTMGSPLKLELAIVLYRMKPGQIGKQLTSPLPAPMDAICNIELLYRLIHQVLLHACIPLRQHIRRYLQRPPQPIHPPILRPTHLRQHIRLPKLQQQQRLPYLHLTSPQRQFQRAILHGSLSIRAVCKQIANLIPRPSRRMDDM